MNYKKEVASQVGDRGKLDKLCGMLNDDFDSLKIKYELLHNTICLMQEGIIRIEEEIQSLKNDLEALNTKKRGKDE